LPDAPYVRANGFVVENILIQRDVSSISSSDDMHVLEARGDKLNQVIEYRGESAARACFFGAEHFDPHELLIEKLKLVRKGRNPGGFPFIELLWSYRRHGKHFVSPELTAELRRVREALAEPAPDVHRLLHPFLDVMLDKHDGRYDYRSYLALELLDLPDEDALIRRPRDSQPELDRSLLLLATDIVRFELDAFYGKSNWMPKRAAGRKLVEERCRRTLKALYPTLARLQLDDIIDPDSPMQSARTLVMAVDVMMSEEEKLRLQLSHVPVYVVHDEYMFIRILQCFEVEFAWLCAQLKAAIHACADDIHTTIARVQQCCEHLKDAAPFFHVLSTLDPESFKAFRIYTEGASAIQSRNYKRVESLCNKPADERLHSLAYQSVPEIQRLVLDGHETLNDVYLLARASGRHSGETLLELAEAMKKFETGLKRWRQSHYSIAVRMLGSGTGTGYTEGTPYLNAVRNLPVFSSTQP
jgi:tryptophan 2,3-dioxygenase